MKGRAIKGSTTREYSFKLHSPRVERIFKHHSLCTPLIALLLIRLPILKAVASLLMTFLSISVRSQLLQEVGVTIASESAQTSGQSQLWRLLQF